MNDQHPHRRLVRVEAPGSACGFVGHMTADELKQRAAHADVVFAVGGAQIDAKLQAAFAAGLRQVSHLVAAAAAPRGVLDAIVRRIGLPPAETTHVLGDEDDLLGAHRHGVIQALDGGGR